MIHGWFASFFYNNWRSVYVAYDAAMLAAMIITALLCVNAIKGNLEGVGKRRLIILGIIILGFLAVELFFVHPTQQLYNDDYIHMSIAKSIVFDNSVGICSFSSPLHCVPGTSGLFQQPTGWAMMLSPIFALFGASFASAFAEELALSLISIFLAFYVSYMLTGDRNISLIATLFLAATPLFLTFSRSAILDTPELTIMLLGMGLLLTYLKDRKPLYGIAAVFAVAYATIMKVDAIVVLPIIALAVLLNLYGPLYWKKGWKRRAVMDVAMIILLIAVMIPQFAFLYNSWSLNTFGSTTMQGRFSLANLNQNFLQNVEFWFGAYGSILFGHGYFTYNIEYPTVYAIFAIVGMVTLAIYGNRRVALFLGLWFAIVFLFYTAYYAGGVLYGAGDDVRYFMSAFPVMALLAAYGIMGTYKAVEPKLRIVLKAKSADKKRKIKMATFAALMIIIMLGPLYGFVHYVAKSPQDIYPFSAERADQQFIMANYHKIPSGCYVMTYQPPLWYMLNMSNIYADWFFIGQYKGPLINMSKGCLYFDYSIDCQTNDIGYDNTSRGCSNIMSNFTMEKIASQPYDKFGWNTTFALYKIVSYKNGTSLYKP